MARVVDVHVASLRKQGHQTLRAWLAADPSHVYVGRDKQFYVPGAVQSKWHNPFSTKKHTLAESLTKYVEHVVKSGLYDQLDELDGMTLGCWCVSDDAPLAKTHCQCHAQVLCHLLAQKKAGS